METNQFELKKYGIGIIADYSDLELKNKQHTEEIEISKDTTLTLKGAVDMKVVVAPGSSVTIREEVSAEKLVYATMHIEVGEGAHVEYIVVQNESDQSDIFVHRDFQVNKDATCNVMDIQIGAKRSLSYTKQHLVGEGASCATRGIFFGNNKQLFDLNTESIHQAGKTSSDILVKGVLDDFAKGIYRGMVKIEESAKQCNGYQKEDTLLLSADAEIDSVPNLEISNNEVSCSHGVTTSRINKEKLFYAQSRGISQAQAIQIFIQGHFGEVLQHLSDEALAQTISDQLIDKLS